jgi:transcription elongation factor Elf1
MLRAVKELDSVKRDETEDVKLRIREMIHSWTVICPRCNQKWLVVNVRNNDSYHCGSCGHGFMVKN